MLGDWLTTVFATFVGLLPIVDPSTRIRIMGFLRVCIGVQFIGIAVVEMVTDEGILGAILEALERRRAGA
jgi:small neutral amino acid transporter SnatA (MarC family)